MDASKLKFNYGGAASDGAALTEYTANSGTVNTLTDAALTQADDYWNGSILRFEADTATSALQGQHYHVVDFDASTDTLTVKPVFAATPTSSDTYKLLQVFGGNYQSDEEMPGLTVDSGASDCTGVDIIYVSAYNGDSDGTLSYTNSDTSLSWKSGSDALAGAKVDVSSDGTYTLMSNDDNKFIIVTVTAASLPGSDQSDTIELSTPVGVIIPNTEANETENGYIRHDFVGLENSDTGTAMENLKVYIDNGFPTAAATTITANKDKTKGILSCADITNWPAAGWIQNNIKTDRSYYYNKSGNSVTLAARNDVCKIAFDAGATEINIGDVITGATSGGSGTVASIQVNSGTWGGSNAAGYLYLKDFNGTSFTNDENLQVSAATVAVADGTETVGHRDCTAVDWDNGDAIQLIPDFDIALDAPSTNQFESLSNESVMPAGLTFTCPTTADDGLSISSIAASGKYGVWVRDTVVEDTRAQSNHVSNLLIRYE